ncbi:MAG: hypothetical protein V1794_00835 [Candidatus Glassbacteria bacterium]
MSKTPIIPTKISTIAILKWLCSVLGGTLLTALPALFPSHIVPLLSKTKWSILSALLLTMLILVTLTASQYHYQLRSKRRPLKILLKKLWAQRKAFPQALHDPEQLTRWAFVTEPIFDHEKLSGMKKNLNAHKSWLLKGDMSVSFLKEAEQGIPEIMDKAIAILQHEIDLV